MIVVTTNPGKVEHGAANYVSEPIVLGFEKPMARKVFLIASNPNVIPTKRAAHLPHPQYHSVPLHPS